MFRARCLPTSVTRLFLRGCLQIAKNVKKGYAPTFWSLIKEDGGVTMTRKHYPSDLTDEQWQLLKRSLDRRPGADENRLTGGR